MMKTWLTRRAVRRPVSRATTSPISSSVCRLPFIRSSALPAADQLHGLGGSGVAVRHVHDLEGRDVDCRRLAAALRILCCGPDQDGGDDARPRPPRRAPWSEVSSQGWATAQGMGRISRVAAISRSYLSWLRGAGSVNWCHLRKRTVRTSTMRSSPASHPGRSGRSRGRGGRSAPSGRRRPGSPGCR